MFTLRCMPLLTPLTIVALTGITAAQNCGVLFKDLVHQPVGGATLGISADKKLVVSNIGSMGLDGVRVLLPDPIAPGTPVSHEVFMSDIDPGGSLPPGAYLHLTTIGSLNGLPDQDVGSLHVESAPGGMIEYTADFSSLGSTTQTIEIYDQGQLVLSVVGHSGVALAIPGWLKCFLRGCPPDNWDPTFGSSVLMTVPGNAPVMGDRARIIAENVVTPPDALTATVLVGKDISEVEFTDEATTGFEPGASYCTAKTGLTRGPPPMSALGMPSASATSGFAVSASPARSNKAGLGIYGFNGRANLPFQGGVLCFAPPVKRTNPLSSGGSGACDGVLSIDFNAFAHGLLGGNPAPQLLVPGTLIDAQFWARDAVATGSLVTDAIEWTVCP